MAEREEVQMKKVLGIIDAYDGKEPLQQFLKEHFRENKNMGSRDRRFYANVIFGYFRVKGNFSGKADQMYITAGAALAEEKEFSDYWAKKLNLHLPPGFSPSAYISFSERISNSGATGYFPLQERISSLIDREAFLYSHFYRPRTWIRCRPDFRKAVMEEFAGNNFSYIEFAENIFYFENNYPLDQLESFAEGYFEVQDIASQKTSEFFHPKKNEAWWDCCAGSGGKSLLLLEKQPQIQLFVSDSRSTILRNLQERLSRNGFVNFHSSLLDLINADEKQMNRLPRFDAILADVPCSGSGTWARTPEWLSYFTAEMLEKHVAVQRKIIENAVRKLQDNREIIYITCSVFADENENNVKWFEEMLHMKIVHQQYIQYSAERGDTMFVATLAKV